MSDRDADPPPPLSAVHLSKKRGGSFVIASFITDGVQKEGRCFVPRGRERRRQKNENKREGDEEKNEQMEENKTTKTVDLQLRIIFSVIPFLPN